MQVKSEAELSTRIGLTTRTSRMIINIHHFMIYLFRSNARAHSYLKGIIYMPAVDEIIKIPRLLPRF